MRDSLRAELERRGVAHHHTQNRDLVLMLPSGAHAVVEMKKNRLYDSGCHAIYEALGQLYYHTRATDSNAILVIVGPAVRTGDDGGARACFGESTEAVFRERLHALGVHLLLATASDDKYVWTGLDEILALEPAQNGNGAVLG